MPPTLPLAVNTPDASMVPIGLTGADQLTPISWLLIVPSVLVPVAVSCLVVGWPLAWMVTGLGEMLIAVYFRSRLRIAAAIGIIARTQLFGSVQLSPPMVVLLQTTTAAVVRMPSVPKLPGSHAVNSRLIK